MDSMLSTAARALAAGEPLLALKGIALRTDAPALALRGVAMAQLGDLPRAQRLLQRAERAFGPSELVARARCVTAGAEVALALRDLAEDDGGLVKAADVLARRGDRANALLARLVLVRRSVLLGRIDEAADMLSRLNAAGAPPRLAAVADLVTAEIAVRRLRPKAALEALDRARLAAVVAKIAALSREVERARRRLAAPAARLVVAGESSLLDLSQVAGILRRPDVIVDACRREVRRRGDVVSLRRRPVLLALLVTLAEALPAAAGREQLIASAFGASRINDSHRARLRVEIGRLRKLIGTIADIRATPQGFALLPPPGVRVSCLLPPAAGETSALLSLLSAGEAWSTSALALALGKSQRSVQRALGTLEEAGTVRGLGRARARRWVIAPSAGFATTLLLVGTSPLS